MPSVAAGGVFVPQTCPLRDCWKRYFVVMVSISGPASMRLMRIENPSGQTMVMSPSRLWTAAEPVGSA
jgi:hypothetical protein